MPASGSDIKAGRAYVELLLKDGAFTKGLKAASGRLQSWGKTIGLIGAGIAGLGTAITAPIGIAIKKFADAGSALNDMSVRTGISGTALAELGYAAEQTGASIDDVEGAIRKMQKFLGSGKTASDATRGALQNLGLTFHELKGLAPDEQFQLISDKIAAIEDPSRRAAAAMEIFGKKGTQILPMIEELASLRKEAQDLGLAPSEESIKMADDLGDAMHRVERVIGSVVSKVGAAFAPVVIEASKVVTSVGVAVGKWVKQNGALIRTVGIVAAGVAAVGTAIGTFGLALATAGLVLGKVVAVVGALGSILGFVVSPLGLIVAAIGAATYAWMNWTSSGQAAARMIGDGLTSLMDIAKTTFGGIADAIKGGNLALAGQIAVAGLKVALLNGLSALSSAMGGAVGDLLGTLGTEILSGDLSGAWSTVVAGMADIWAGFAEGMVAVFTTSARAVTQIWQDTVTGISNWLLKKSSEGGVLGKTISKVLGVDLQAEQKRRDALDAALAKTQHGAKGGSESVLSEAQRAAGEQIAGKADAFRSTLSGFDQSAQARSREAAEKFRRRTTGGSDKASEAAKAAEAELEKATAAAELAAAEAAAANPEKPKIAAAGGNEDDFKKEVVGTFSAAALAAQGNGSDVAAQQLDEQKKLRGEMVKTRRAIETGGVFAA